MRSEAGRSSAWSWTAPRLVAACVLIGAAVSLLDGFGDAPEPAELATPPVAAPHVDAAAPTQPDEVEESEDGVPAELDDGGGDDESPPPVPGAGIAVPYGLETYPPACPAVSDSGAPGRDGDVDRLLAALGNGTVLENPFKRAVYLCAPFSAELYDALDQGFPPQSVMYNLGGKRWKMDAESLLKLDAKKAKSWSTYARDKEAWQRVHAAVFSKTFETALLGKLGVTQAVANRDFRVQLDAAGFAIGVHPDNPVKIVTLQFYLPNNAEQEMTYGTCLHTVAQNTAAQKKKKGSHAVAPCAAKFRFAPNTGYTFSVHKTSFHSVEKVNAKRTGERRTFMVNWYRKGQLPVAKRGR